MILVIKINKKTVGTPKDYNYGSLLYWFWSTTLLKKNQNDMFILYLRGQMLAGGYRSLNWTVIYFKGWHFQNDPTGIVRHKMFPREL